jgi:large subunit ribosomal protein L5
METVQARIASVFETLKGEFGYKNVNEAPIIDKVIVSVGVGRIDDKGKIALIQDRLAKITGQKAAPRAARMSIASFKLREGDIVGYQVTLRGQRKMDFLNKLIHVALPQTRDFRGLKITSIDEMGNYTLGIKDNSIFPETADEDLKDIFGMSITIVTTTNDKVETEALLRHIGMPLKKPEVAAE